MKLKRTQVQWMVPRWRNSSGFSGGGIREAEPLPTRPRKGGLLSPATGPSCLHLISTLPTARGLSPAAAGNLPSERRLMDLSPLCHPAQPALTLTR